ncbi:MAG: VanW family protein [Christensenellaceae bacterium]|jgi:vancomycin resistance protein YoaR|nr:VanW family protein [Christensenellaceae bacterium]
MRKLFLSFLIFIFICPNFAFTQNVVLRAEFQTTFYDNPQRKHNISLSISKFNNLIINAGDEVSFNNVVGKRTKENGFLDAKIILDGEYVDGIGGGVCQTSTTIFNAVILAGLEITESHNHSLPSHYVPLGKDAMVSSGADLRFVNNTGKQIIFKTGVNDNIVWVKIYGRSKGENINYALSTNIIKEYPPKNVYLLNGEKIDFVWNENQYTATQIDNGSAGYAVDTYFECRKKNKLLFKKFLRKNVYKSQPVKYSLSLIQHDNPQIQSSPPHLN